MNIILFDGISRGHLLPLTLTRPVADIRIGITTIREKWELKLQEKTSTYTLPYLQDKFPLLIRDDNILIDGSLIPDDDLAEKIISLRSGDALLFGKRIIACRVCREKLEYCFSGRPVDENGLELPEVKKAIPVLSEVSLIQKLTDIFTLNGECLRADFRALTKGRQSQPISPSNRIIGDEEAIFIETGVIMEGATLNSLQGPIYIGKNAEIMEGSFLRGNVSVGEHAIVKVGARIFKDTTIGPYCKVSGEINNVVFIGYSNKAHDGYLGNSVIGEWCNIAAGSNFSNLQNNYNTTKQWDYMQQDYRDTGLQFCGVVMGDHTKCSINSKFNSGTVTGVCCNLFGTEFHSGFIPSFSYGGDARYTLNRIDKVLETAERVFSRRGIAFDHKEKDLLLSLFRQNQERLKKNTSLY